MCVSLVETNTLYPTGSKRVQTFTLCLGHSFLSARRSFKAQRSPSRTVRVVYQTVSFSSSRLSWVSFGTATVLVTQARFIFNKRWFCGVWSGSTHKRTWKTCFLDKTTFVSAAVALQTPHGRRYSSMWIRCKIELKIANLTTFLEKWTLKKSLYI